MGAGTCVVTALAFTAQDARGLITVDTYRGTNSLENYHNYVTDFLLGMCMHV